MCIDLFLNAAISCEGKRIFSLFLLMTLTSQRSLINPKNLSDIRLVMSDLFVLARIHSLMQKKKKLVACFSCPMRNAYELFLP